MSNNKQRILITGGLGAIGQNLSKQLNNEQDCEITIIDNLSSSGLINNFEKNFHYLDISNTEKLISFFRSYKPQVVFHLAAHFANQNSVDHPISDVATNVIGIINLFESQKSNSELKKIVYASSSCVYGNLNIMREGSPVLPFETPYAINKFTGELYCKYYSEIFGLPNVIIRIFNSFGPGELSGKYRNVIPNFISKALKGEDIVITGTGNETRDFCYVDNTVSLLRLAADSNYKDSQIFNGGTGIATRIIDLAELILELTGSNSKIVLQDKRDWDHVQERKADISISCEQLNYMPDVDLKKQLSNTIQWFQDTSCYI